MGPNATLHVTSSPGMRWLVLFLLALITPSPAAADDATQRNLTDAGRADAKRVGAVFQGRAIPVAACSRARGAAVSTARLAFGRAEVWSPLSNLLDNRARETEQMQALKEIVGRRPTGGNLLLVTHGSVVLPLTGIQPAPAELVVLTPEGPDRFKVAGRLTP